MPPRKPTDPTPIDAITHGDRRVNIPTEELRDFVADQEEHPANVLYPRDPSLDPQLVWQGKDEQDREDLAVPVVPVYIQEKIKPQVVIEDLRRQARQDTPPAQLDLFSDFNGIEFEDLVDFYQHEQNWTNRLILGDSLLVMASLAEKEGLKGQVQMIYLDPPYGIKFGSNWQVSTRKRDVKDGKAEDLTRQPEQVRAFRDTWKLGIHSYLAYLRDRFQVAHELLTETGSIFVQIGDENVHLVRCVLDEVFGSENFVLSVVVKKKGATTVTDPVNDFLLWYARDKSQLKTRRHYEERRDPTDDPKFNTLISPHGEHIRISQLAVHRIPELLDDGWCWARVNYPLVSQDPGPRSVEFLWRGRAYSCGGNRHWTFDPESGMERLGHAQRLFDGGGASLGGVVFWNDWPFIARSNLWDDLHGEQEVVYVVQTNRKVVERCLLMTTDPGDLVLDPTCGSGTTAYVAEQWGRRWITIDTSRVALALARTRLMAARYPWYNLADAAGGDIKQGFVYKTVPHITLKSIANNEEIDEIHQRWQAKLEPLREQLNAAAGQQWQEWEVPREPGEGWAPETVELLETCWRLRRERQAEMDASIARRADTETLYDQPETDNKRVRVTGPFTVESLSPHRVLSADEEIPADEQEARDAPGPGQFVTMILENLRSAGVQNTIKQERLKFDLLEPYAGQHLHAAGEYTEEDGSRRRVAVCVGPEHGTVGPQLVKEAAKEAVQGVGFDTLIVCGFAFDPHVSEETRRYGTLTVLPTRMNPDLAMGEDLLKKTGAGNLFMIFGEPDLEVTTQADGQIVVSLRGVDVYDPTTGEIRSHSTDDVACWFIDTDYNGESFFVRHAYFTGADEPYDKLKRALRAEIDESAWASLYSTTSRPFPRPASGKIAVKVINHYGDEVLKVYEV